MARAGMRRARAYLVAGLALALAAALPGAAAADGHRQLQPATNTLLEDPSDTNATAVNGTDADGNLIWDVALLGFESAEELKARTEELINSVRSEKCDAMHSLTCVVTQQTCLRWDAAPEDGGPGNCSVLPTSDRPGPIATDCYYGDSDDGLGGMPFLLLSLAIGCGVTTLLAKLSSHKIAGKKLGLPFTVVMFMFGFGVESIFQLEMLAGNFTRMELSISGWVNSHPHIILFVLLPPLLFEDSASIDYHVFRKSLPSSLLLAGPGVMMSSCFSGCFSYLLFNVWAENDYSIYTHMLLGGILSATDPVAVLGVLKSLGAPEKLNLIIGGESLLNDGTAVVVFWIFRDLVAECSDTDWKTVLGRFFVLAVGGVSWGWFAAHMMYLWIKLVRDPVIEVSIVITCVFAVFWMAEELLGVSGILASVVFGLATARKSYFCMSAECLERNHMVWEQMGFVTTMIIFMLTGIVARGKLDAMYNRVEDASDILGGSMLSNSEVNQLMTLTLVFYVAVFAVRGLTLTLLFPILQKIGYGVTLKECVFMTWGGLRGAVSLALALLIDAHPTIDNKTKDFILIQTAGVVTLSLLINGTTAGYLYAHLRLYRTNRYHDQLVQQAMGCLHDDTMSWVYSALSPDDFHQNADLTVVQELMPDFSKAELLHEELINVTTIPIRKASWPAAIGVDESGEVAEPGSARKEDLNMQNMMGSSDPYVELVLDRGGRPSKRKSTGIIKKNLNPIWKNDNTFTYSVYGSETTLYATVFDWDFGPKDDYLGEAKISLLSLIEETKYPRSAEKVEQVNLTPPSRNFTLEESIMSSFEGGSGGRSGMSPAQVQRPGSVSPRTANAQGGDIVDDMVDLGGAVVDGVLDSAGFIVGGLSKGITGMYKATEATARNATLAASQLTISARQAAMIRGSLTVKVKYTPADPTARKTSKISDTVGDSPLLGKQLANLADGMADVLVQEQTIIGTVAIEVLHATNLAASDPANMSTANQKLVAETPNHDEVDMLSDANRMVRIETGEGQSGFSEFDARNALYGVFLQHLLATFRQASEADAIGDAATNALEHAVGVANDVAVLAHETGKLERGALLVMWDEVKTYIRTGNNGVLGTRVPHLWFAHMLTSAEMLFMVNKGFEAVSSRTWGTLTEEESAADDQILEELQAVKFAAKSLIAEQRRHMPNTYQAIHTVIAFRVVVDEYRHRLKKAYDMGCVSRKMQQAVESALEQRIVELNDFFFPSTSIIIKTLLGLGQDETSAHPAVMSFWRDQTYQKTHNLSESGEGELNNPLFVKKEILEPDGQDAGALAPAAGRAEAEAGDTEQGPVPERVERNLEVDIDAATVSSGEVSDEETRSKVKGDGV